MKIMIHVVAVIISAGLILSAFFSARDIPSNAMDDFNEYARINPMNSPGFPEAYMQMHCERRLLQTFLIGASGLVILFVSLQGLSQLQCDRKSAP